MKKRRILFVVGLLLAISVVTVAAKYLISPFNKEVVLPPAKEELGALIRTTLQKEYNVSGEIRLYDSKDTNTVKEQTPFAVYKKDNNFYTLLGSVQSICNGEFFVQLDTANKYLLITPVTDSTYERAADNFSPIQKMLDDTTGLKITATVKGNDMQRVLMIYDEHTPEIKSTQVVYHAKDYRISSVTIAWWKNPAITNHEDVWLTKMNYNYNTAPLVNIEKKMEEIIAIKKDGTVTVNERYRNYLLQKEI